MTQTERVREALADRNLKEVARRTGIKYSTVRRVFMNPEFDPPVSVIEQLSRYLGVDLRSAHAHDGTAAHSDT